MGRNTAVPVLATVMIAVGTLVPAAVAVAAPGDVVINEIMYHAESDLDGDEFIEILNPGATPVDISDWCLGGVTFCFDPGTTIAGGEFLVVASDAARFQSTYGFVPDGVFESGSVSNGGENITLSDAGGALIDSVEYSDSAPWPTSADGLGPSIELIDPSLDNDDWLNWAASTAGSGHTAGAANSVAATGLPPRISDVSATPTAPDGNDDVTITATIVGASSATVSYRVNFDGEQTIVMSSTGGDGYAATIPDQAPGDLIRYRVTANSAGGTSRYPRADDTITYDGVVVASGVSSEIPILEWFIADSDYDLMVSNPTNDNIERYGALAYDGVVIDNVLFNIRGRNSQKAPKVNWKAEMPQGHDLDMPGVLVEPVDELALQADWSDHAHGRAMLSWYSYEAAGVINTQAFPVRVQRNGDFQGLYTYVDLLDGTWREREGYDDDELFKASTSAFSSRVYLDDNRFEKKNPKDEDYSSLAAFLDGVDLNGSAQRNYLLEHADIPQMINYAAVTAIIEHHDSSSKNFYLTPESTTDRWRILPWDLDHTFGNGCCSVSSDFVTPAEPGDKTNDLMEAILGQPDWAEMYFRRLSTLVDEVLEPGRLEGVYDAVVGPAQPEANLDWSTWPHSQWHTYSRQRTRLFSDIQARRNAFARDARVPGPQPAAPEIIINELNYAPAVGGDGEYIELYNPSATQAIDISNWSISDAIDLQIQPGTVILPESYMLFVADDATFRSTYSPTLFVGGRYSGGLSSSGETVTLRRADGSVADQLTYGGSGWANAQDGPSLELIDHTIDNDDPTNWGVSNQPLGTPGAANDPGEAGGTGGEPTPIILNEYNGVDDANLLDDGAAVDPFWGAVAGNGGDWIELVVTEDHVDMRGLQIRWSDDSGAAGGTLVLSNHPLWSDVRAGTIVTVAESLADDVSYDPASGDWWINVQASSTASGTFITAADFSTSNSDTQITILTADDSVLFGPAGEGVVPASGVGSSEIFHLEEDPSSAIESTSGYDDSTESTFGAPNVWDDGASVQDFSTLRPIVAPDTTDPTTSLSAPVNGSTLTSGSVAITGSAADNADVDRVEVTVQDTGSGLWLQSNGTFGAAPAALVATLSNDVGVSADWTLSTALPDGTYIAAAVAFDGAGNADATAAVSSFTVAVPLPDTVDPTTSLASPVNGSTVASNSVSIAGSAADDVDLDRVEVSVQDTGSGLWLQSNGSFGAAPANLVASLSNDVGTSADWSLSVTLPDGAYTVSATAFDVSANSDGSPAVSSFTVDTFVPDTTDPSTVLTSPVNGSTLTSGSVAITGSAADNAEVDRVEVSVQDTGSGLWLQSNGSFGAAPANLVATLSNDVGTSADWSLSATLPDGDYTVSATAFDASSNSDGTAATSSFTVAVPPPDTTDPTTSLSAPVNGSTVASNSVSIAGSAADDVDLDRVEVSVQDTGSGLWLQSNGTFAAAPASLVATLSNDVGTSADWSLSATLPDGAYTASATAFDSSANSDATAAVTSFTVDTFVPDTTDPTTSLTSPVNGSTVASNSVSIAGSAADNVEVDRVEVTVQDTGTGLWLQSNGSFGAAPANLVASLSNDVGTSADWSLAVTLPDGDYTASATAFDASANSDGTAATSSFTVDTFVPVASVEFRAAATANANRPAVPVTVPGAVEAGDVLVLFVQGNRNNASVTAPPSGWTLLDTLQDGTTESWVYTRIAPPGYAGSTVQVGFSVRMKTSVTLVAYSGASGVSAIAGLGEPGSSSSHDAPSVAVDVSGSLVVTHWGDKTSGHSGWTMPAELTEVASTSGSSGGQINTTTAETAPVDAGVWPGATATSGTSGSKMIAWSVVIAPE